VNSNLNVEFVDGQQNGFTKHALEVVRLGADELEQCRFSKA
jgi:hypothetical protein